MKRTEIRDLDVGDLESSDFPPRELRKYKAAKIFPASMAYK